MAHNDTHAARKKGGAGKILLVVLLLLLLAASPLFWLLWDKLISSVCPKS